MPAVRPAGPPDQLQEQEQQLHSGTGYWPPLARRGQHKPLPEHLVEPFKALAQSAAAAVCPTAPSDGKLPWLYRPLR